MSWTKEMVEIATQARREGLTASEVVMRLRASGFEKTRNAIVGMWWRAGLSVEQRKVTAAQKRAERKRAAAGVRPERRVRLQKPTAAVDDFTLPDDRDEPDELPRIRWAAHEHQHCHWPIGDPSDWENFRMCGNEHLPNRVYCAHHTLRAVKVPVARKTDVRVRTSKLRFLGRVS